MGKASSSKKVARAAGTGGGRTHRGRTPWSYYGIILVVVLFGVIGTVTSRGHRLAAINTAGTVPPTVGGTPWNEGFAVYQCDKFVSAIKVNKDPTGITTQGDGIIHIHPFVKSAAGKNATLGKFTSSIGMKLNADELQVPGGHLYHDGDSCGGKASHVYVKEYAYVGDTTGNLQTVDPQSIRLSDQSLLTIAFVPASDKGKIPPPPKYVSDNLNKLAAQASATTTTTTTTPGAPAAP
ncbi:MAG: hypothetical protein M3R71_03585, partial [Actinomycetota bacterium]|nr:hypothetical protein [Actinomycetota bacterium]